MNFSNKAPFLKMAAITFSVLIIATVFYIGYILIKANNALESIAAPKPTIGSVQSMLPTSPMPNNTNGDLMPMTFLVDAIDNRVGSDSLNTDVMMLIALNPGTQSATIVSIPRDIHFIPQDLPSQKANYYYAYYYSRDKFSAITNTQLFLAICCKYRSITWL